MILKNKENFDLTEFEVSQQNLINKVNFFSTSLLTF
jgi:hypothetical protein